MCSVSFSGEFIQDSRLEYLAHLSGETKVTSLGRVLMLWFKCKERLNPSLTSKEIDLIVGWFNPEKGSFADLLSQAKLATFDGGNQTYTLEIIREQIEQILELRRRGLRGGKSRIAQAQRDSFGRIVSSRQPLDKLQATPGENLELLPAESKPKQPKFDLEAVYKLYPRKQGKSEGMRRLKTQIKLPTDYEDLILAVKNYAAYCAGKEPQFIKMFSSFVSEWRDWTDPSNGTVTLIGRELKPINLEDL
jgi:hypothetical protein